MATGSNNPSIPIQAWLPRNPNTKIKELFEVAKPLHIAVYNLADCIAKFTGRIDESEVYWPQLGYSQILTGTLNKVYAICNVNIPIGSFVTFTSFGSTIRALLAQANSVGVAPSRAVNVNRTYISGQWGEFVVSPVVMDMFSGLTPGATYYLSTTVPGGIQATKPVGAAEFQQQVGWALSDTALMARPDYPFLTNNT